MTFTVTPRDIGPHRRTRGVASRVVRHVCVAQGVAAVVDGAVLATSAVHFVRDVGLPIGVVGSALAFGAASALTLGAPLGALADRIGLHRAAAAYSALVAAALLGYAAAGTAWAYTVAAVVFGVAQAGLAATRHAIVAAAVAPDARVRARALVHTVLNAGLGAGALVGAVVLTVGSAVATRATFTAGAVVALGCGAWLHRLPASHRDAVGRRPSRLGALRDSRLVVVTLLTAVVQLVMPVLSVILPLWLTTRTSAPAWVPGAALGMNTVLVLIAQTRWSARVRDNAGAARSALVAGASLLAACVLLGATGAARAPMATALALVGVLALTTGEVTAGPAAWHLGLRHAPEGREGQYQAVFGMASSLARVAGSTLALSGVMAFGPAGWVGLGAVTAAAACGLALVARQRPGDGLPGHGPTPRRQPAARRTSSATRSSSAGPSVVSA